MSHIFPDLLRAVVTDIMLILLLSTMATPKYKSKWIYILSTAIILITNIGVNFYFYLSENYTIVFYTDLIMLIVIGIALKPLFSDKIMQWCFSFITMLNIYAAVVFLSYILYSFFPWPVYVLVFLRFVLFLIVIFLFKKWVSKLYHNVLDYWHIYILPILTLLICFLGYFFGGDIEEMLSNNYLPLMLLILLGISIYIATIHSLKTITSEYTIREENQTMQSEREYLHLAAEGLSKRIQLMEEVSAQNNRAAHDRRHLYNLLLELLAQGQTEEIAKMLQNENATLIKTNRVYCENSTVNASVSHYANLAEQAGIATEIQLNIPSAIEVDSLELAMVVSNLMENAIQACKKLENSRYLRFTCLNVGRLLLEIVNPCNGNSALDENGYPVSEQNGHGIGSKSVLAFAKKYDGELIYKIENGFFSVRLLV